MGRFFEKSKQIDSLDESDIQDFLVKEKLADKVDSGRVQDFYNRLSDIALGNTPDDSKPVDYDYFNCKTQEDIEKINSLKKSEIGFLDSINPELLRGSRLLKAAAALGHRYEKMMNGEFDSCEDDHNEYLRRLFKYEEDPELDDKPATFGELLEQDIDYLKYIALLNDKKAFAKSTGRLHRDPTGRIIKLVQMESFGEIYNMDLLQVAMPNFRKKLATKDIYVRNRFDRREKGQNLIVLVDDSGSMSHSIKKAMLKAAICLKIRDISEAHNLYIGTFEKHVFGFKKIERDTKFEDLTFIRLGGGTTDVNGCIKDTISQIKTRKLKSFGGDPLSLTEDHFEILVVNDGQDSVDKTYHPNIKLHALCLMESNNNLKNICHRSGGTYYHLKNDNDE